MQSDNNIVIKNYMPNARGHRDWKKRPGVDFFFLVNFVGLTNLCNQAHI
jgi:hypothetical protein